ncbi:MAG: hypothetical protein ACR2GO_08950 [Candidatus Limnocylindria bacterium]
MTDGMLNQNHPDDEHLSALASHETDATADATLTTHVSSCDRCTELVSELRALRTALADLPDVQPSRPLRLLPPVEAQASGVDRLGGWARRFFAPVLAAGAAVAMVGVVGTAAPALNQMDSGPQDDSAAAEEFSIPGASAAGREPTTLDTAGEADGGAFTGASEPAPQVVERSESAVDEGASISGGDDLEAPEQAVSADRSPWPMVLFAGVALMIAALLMRWILVPRAG